MNVLIPALVFIACAVAIAIIGAPGNGQVGTVGSTKRKQWRRVLFVIQIAAGIVAAWQANGA